MTVKLLVLLALTALPMAAQTPKPVALDKPALESYLRHLMPYPAEVKIEVGDPKPSTLPGFSQVRVLASMGSRFKEHLFEVAPDGKRFFEAEIHELGKNPFADNLAKLKTDGQPMLGTPGAPVTLVLFSDFQCQYCREQSRILRQELLKAYPKEVRLYFKDYPLEQIHPWARTASLAARCAMQQKPEAFWDYHDYVFDKQAEFKPENVREKSVAWATGKGLDAAKFSTCLESKAPDKEISRNVLDGREVGVNSTPMLFINGRRVSGVLEWTSLKMLIDLELDYARLHSAPDAACCSVELPSPFTPKKK